MIRQFTIIPALLGIAALVISACSAEVGGGKSNVAGVELDENATGNTSVAASVSASTTPTAGDTSATTNLEGTWVGMCDTSMMQYSQETISLVGDTFTQEQLTYSDSACSVRSSGSDFHATGTFTIEDEGIVDGKQLTKINWNGQVHKSEGFIALFFPQGSSFTMSSAWFVDGDKMYDTDGETNLLGDGSYASATQIYYDDYHTRQ
jgi:hypothetical protein